MQRMPISEKGQARGTTGNTGAASSSSCSRERVANLICLVLALGNAADAVEISCVGFIMASIPNVSQLDDEFLSAAVFLGMLFGGLLAGVLSDVIGRKPVLLYSLGVNALMGLISAFVPNVDWLIFCRVIAGIGIGGSVPVVFSMGAEIFPPISRGKYLSIVASFWMVGAIYTAIFAWVMLGDNFSGDKILPGVTWRLFAAVCAIPAFGALFLTYRYVPESPRFLSSKGKDEDAANVETYLNGEVDYVVSMTGRVSESSSSAKRNRAENDSVGSTSATCLSTLGLLFSRNVIHVTATLMLIWFTLSFGSYGISTWITKLFEDVGLSNAYFDSFIFALANLPGNLISILFVEVFGRRRLLCIGMVLAALSAVGFAVLSTNAIAVVTAGALFNAFSVIGWNSLDCLSCESFPTNMRTTGMGTLAAAGRIGAITAQFVNGSLESNVPLLLGVTSACMIIGGVSSFGLPSDNTGTELPDDADDPTYAYGGDAAGGERTRRGEDGGSTANILHRHNSQIKSASTSGVTRQNYTSLASTSDHA
jgi:MFS family permease